MPAPSFADELLELESELRCSCVVRLPQDGIYVNTLKGAVIKCFEFAKQSHLTPPSLSSFFLAPVLRGICEDLIALKFLVTTATAPKRDELLKRRMLATTFASVDRQSDFFRKHRPYQPVFRAKLKKEPVGGGLPPMKDMAAKTQLDDLYAFLYSIASDCVHFNPRIIVRNAWGDAESSFVHSTRNFEEYYSALCRVYGTHLLVMFLQEFSDALDASAALRQRVEKLSARLIRELRWPEAVTYEEMNQVGPSDAERVLLRAKHRATRTDA